MFGNGAAGQYYNLRCMHRSNKPNVCVSCSAMDCMSGVDSDDAACL